MTNLKSIEIIIIIDRTMPIELENNLAKIRRISSMQAEIESIARHAIQRCNGWW